MKKELEQREQLGGQLAQRVLDVLDAMDTDDLCCVHRSYPRAWGMFSIMAVDPHTHSYWYFGNKKTWNNNKQGQPPPTLSQVADSVTAWERKVKAFLEEGIGEAEVVIAASNLVKKAGGFGELKKAVRALN